MVGSQKPLDPFKRLLSYYPTTEPAESSLLQATSIPRELLVFVPPAKLSEVGDSGRRAKLKKGTPEGSREEAPLTGHSQACDYLSLCRLVWRLVNNLLTRQRSTVLISLQSQTSQPLLKSRFWNWTGFISILMTNTFDMKSTNNDLLNGAISQYSSAQTQTHLCGLFVSVGH